MINEDIRARKVRVVADNENLGEYDTISALTIARQMGKDLVQVSDGSVPTCRILDYNKWLYEKKKKAKEAAKTAKKQGVKEFKFSVNIGDHDQDVRLDHAFKALDSGLDAKITVTLFGRHRGRPELGMAKIQELSDIFREQGYRVENPSRSNNLCQTMVRA